MHNGAIVLSMALLGASDALAQEEVCTGAVNLAEFGAAMDMVEAAVAKPDIDDARYLLQQMHPIVPCLTTVVDTAALTRYAALRATVAFFDQDEGAVVQWGLLATYAAGDAEAFPDLPETHPLRESLAYAEEPQLAGPIGESLDPPKGGGVFLNGALATQPRWRVEVPALIQVFDKKQRLTYAGWQDGAAFSDEVLTPGTFALEPPKWWTGAVIAPVEIAGAPEAVAKAREDAKPPKENPISVQRLAIGGGFAVLSGSLYALAALSSGGLDEATTEDELVAARSRTNLLVVGSGLTAAGAVGIGVTAFLSHGPGVGVLVRY